MPRPSRTDASDQQLVAWALGGGDGSQDAYRALVHRYTDAVMTVIYQVVRNRERAKDLAQDTFAKAFTKLDSYRPERKFRPWILTIAHNTALKYVERRRVDSLDSQLVMTPREIDANAMRSLSASETPTPMPHPDAAGLGAAIEALRPTYRRCIKLRYVEDRSYDDIADLMGVSRDAVGTYLHRARQELKKALE